MANESAKKMTKAERKARRIHKICEATGWSNQEAEAKMQYALELGIPNQKYVAGKCWEFTDEELPEWKELLDMAAEKEKTNEVWYANVVSQKTGWAYEDALRILRAVKAKKYTYRVFIRKALWRKTEEEIMALPPYEAKVSESEKADRENTKKKVQQYRKLIMEEMGWTLGRVRIESYRSKLLCGTNNSEFYLFKVYKNGIEAGKKFITDELNGKMKERYADWGGKNKLFENKGQFNKDFNAYIRRRWFLNTGLTYEDFLQKIEGLDKIIFKPLNGIEGRGIQIFELNHTEQNNKEVYEAIVNGPKAIVEQFITQHHAISEFYPNCVNTLRIMSILDNGEGKILNVVMKFGTRSKVDNYYQGGLAVGVDEKTGIIRTEGVDYAGNLYKVHPYSQKQFLGFQIPHWDKVVEMIRVAAAVHPEVPYVGWDVSITEDGPEIVEGNHNQGAYLVQYPFAIYSLEGRRHTIEPYLWFDK